MKKRFLEISCKKLTFRLTYIDSGHLFGLYNCTENTFANTYRCEFKFPQGRPSCSFSDRWKVFNSLSGECCTLFALHADLRLIHWRAYKSFILEGCSNWYLFYVLIIVFGDFCFLFNYLKILGKTSEENLYLGLVSKYLIFTLVYGCPSVLLARLIHTLLRTPNGSLPTQNPSII